MASNINDDLTVSGHLTATTMEAPADSVARTAITQEAFAVFPVKLTDFRVHDAFATPLTGTSTGDDLGLYGGTFGSDVPALKTYDVKSAGALSFYGRALIVMPECYDEGQSVKIRCSAGMLTTVADTSCTLDVEAYESDREGAVSGSDLCGTAATSINSLTLANKDFTITSGNLAAGDVLDVRLTVAVNDGAGGATVQAIIGAVELMCDIRG